MDMYVIMSYEYRIIASLLAWYLEQDVNIIIIIIKSILHFRNTLMKDWAVLLYYHRSQMFFSINIKKAIWKLYVNFENYRERYVSYSKHLKNPVEKSSKNQKRQSVTNIEN